VAVNSNSCSAAVWAGSRLLLHPFGGALCSRVSGMSERMRLPKLRKHTSPSLSGPTVYPLTPCQPGRARSAPCLQHSRGG